VALAVRTRCPRARLAGLLGGVVLAVGCGAAAGGLALAVGAAAAPLALGVGVGVAAGAAAAAALGTAMPAVLGLLGWDRRLAGGPVARAVAGVVAVLLYFQVARWLVR
jgi:Mg/Co/Ni transporter MgtE